MQVLDPDPGDGGVTNQRHHVVAVAAEHHRVHVAHRHAELHRDETAEPGAVEHAGHAHDLVFRETQFDPGQIGHHVERVADHDDGGVGRVFLDVFADAADDAGVGFQQVIAAHARFAGDAAGDDNQIAARAGGGVVGAGDLRVKSFEAGRLHHVERLALGHAFDDVDHHDIGELFFCDPLCGCRTDKPRAKYCDFPIHEIPPNT